MDSAPKNQHEWTRITAGYCLRKRLDALGPGMFRPHRRLRSATAANSYEFVFIGPAVAGFVAKCWTNQPTRKGMSPTTFLARIFPSLDAEG